MRVLTSQQMREADRQTTEEIGIPSLVLMENAGRQVVASMESTFEDLQHLHVSVVCGKGNNGGDGFVVALLNPKTAVFFAAFLPQFMDAAVASVPQALLLGALFVIIAALTDTTYALAASSVAPALTRANAFRAAGRYLSGGVFIALGVLAAFTGDGRRS